MKSKINKKIIFFNRLFLLIFSNIGFLQRQSTYRTKIYAEKEKSKLCKNNNSPWDSELWLNLKVQNLKNLSKGFNYNRNFSFLEICFNLLVHFEKELKIIDFGGGGGIFFEYTKNYFSNKQDISTFYYLLDSKKNLSICKNKLISSKNCKLGFVDSKFFDSWISENNGVDIILFSAVLQYLDDWQLVIDKLLKLKPKIICILKLPIAEFASKPARVVQNVKTKQGYCGPAMLTLFSQNSLNDFMLKNKYKLLFELPDSLENKNYFKFGCEDINYKFVKPWNYIYFCENFKLN